MIRRLHIIVRPEALKRHFKLIQDPRQHDLELHGRHVLTETGTRPLAPGEEHVVLLRRAGGDGAVGDPATRLERLRVGEIPRVAIRRVCLHRDEGLRLDVNGRQLLSRRNRLTFAGRLIPPIAQLSSVVILGRLAGAGG